MTFFLTICFSTTLLTGASASEKRFLTLFESVQLAIENNHMLEEEEANLDFSKAKRSEVRRGKGPILAFTSVAERIGGDAYLQARMLGKKYEQNYLNQFELTMPLYTGGELEHGIKIADYGVDLSLLALESARQKLKEQVANSYYLALQAQAMLQVQKERVDNIYEHLKMVEAMYRVGTVAKADVLRTEVALANARQKLRIAQNDSELAKSSLNSVIGLDLNTALLLEDTNAIKPIELSLEEASDYALFHRPEIFMTQIALHITTEQKEMAKAGYRPKIQAILKKTLGGEKPFANDHKNLDAWSIGVALKWNIFDQGITNAKITQQMAQLKKAEAKFFATTDAVLLDVKNAYLTLQASKENIDTAQVALEKAKEDYRIAKVRYSAGVGTNLDVMDAESALTATKTLYQNAIYTYNKSSAALERAIGKKILFDVEKYVPKMIPLHK